MEQDTEALGSSLDKAHKARDLLFFIAGRIDVLAEAAGILGLQGLDDQLFDISNKIKSATDDLYAAWREEFSSHYDPIKDASRNVLEATLAGLKLAEQSKETGDSE